MTNRTLLLPGLTAVALALGACGSSAQSGGGSSASTVTSTTPATTATSTTPTPPAASLPPKVAGISTDLTRKPSIPRQKGRPPRSLVKKDIVKGTGAVATAGANLSVQYVGTLFANGRQFDASWDRGQPFQFTLGAGNVIPGWDRGLVGMRAGGRRLLVIPGRLAYGAQGSPPVIGPNATLNFVIDLQGVQGGSG